LVSVLLVATGCRQYFQRGKPVEEAVFARCESELPEPIRAAFEAVGPLEAWLRADKLQARCIVTFYKPNPPSAGYYLTEQVHEIEPWAGSVRISADEPQGRLVWQLSNAGFKVLYGAERVANLPVKLCDENFATLLLDMTTAPVRIISDAGPVGGTNGTSCSSIKYGQAVKIKGQWYYPIELTGGEGKVTRIFYQPLRGQNADSSLPSAPRRFASQNEAAGRRGGRLDIIRLVDEENEVFLMAHGYNYRKIKGLGIAIPNKIEIFKTHPQGARGQKLVEVSYHTVRPSRKQEIRSKK